MAREYSEDELERAHKVLSTFSRDFVMKYPFSEYVNGVGITSFDFAKTLADQGYSPGNDLMAAVELVRKELQKQGEDPDELVLQAHLLRPLPKGMSLPETYEGLKVFTLVTGKAILY